MIEKKKDIRNSSKKESSGRALLIYFLEFVFKSSFVHSLVEYLGSVLKTDRLLVAVVSCVWIS